MTKEQKVQAIIEQLEQLKPFAKKFNSLTDKLYELDVVKFYSYIDKFWKTTKNKVEVDND